MTFIFQLRCPNARRVVGLDSSDACRSSGKHRQQVQRAMGHFVHDLIPQVVESIVEQARQVMCQERVVKRSKKHHDLGTIQVPVVPTVEEKEIMEVVQIISQEPVRN